MFCINPNKRIERVFKYAPNIKLSAYLRYQQTLELLSKNYLISKNKKYSSSRKFILKKNIIKIWYYSLMFLITLFNIIKYTNKEIVLIYIITKKNKIDDRCITVCNHYDKINSLFLRHEAYPEDIKIIPLKNVVYYEILVGITYILYKFINIKILKKRSNYSLLRSLHIKSSITRFVISSIYRIAKVRYFISIDDSRHTGEIRYISKINNIQSIAIQHGQISSKFTGLSKYKFNKYILWGPVFLNQLKKHGYNIDKNIIFGIPDKLHQEIRKFNFEIKLSNYNYRRNSNLVLVVQENLVDEIFYIELLKYLNRSGFKVLFRPKNKKIDKHLHFNLLDNQIDNSDNIYTTLRLIKPLVVIGAKSTALIESWIFHIPSISVLSQYNEPNIFPAKYSIFHSVSLDQLQSVCDKAKELSIQNIIEIKNYLWGDINQMITISNIINKIDLEI